MGHHSPEIPIQVDDETGVWSTDGLPMLYVPRHFFINNHAAVEDAIGEDQYAELLYKAGYKSAYFWCEQEGETHGISGAEVFDHYMKRLSQRGWGQFFIEHLDVSQGVARVRLENSAFVYYYGKVNRKVDYMFTGWFAGAMDQVTESVGFPFKTHAVQLQSGSEEGCDFGIFEVKPIG
ncbi:MULTISPECIES: DUF5943 domain-containing protein [Grimontia]|uniref:4-vinyl reductase 4VR domain-containing protein n=1 Tax=Grimontia marina TaxID=646534 RepID=A0A128F1T9_9GAMM|nr:MULTISPECIES: DUF5943 domain-containing protein [Grimontia]WRW00516.1 DUF5943 domain-containing protein [Grimontia sp. NTOU-MAR1]CZF80753.1 hypothetical protein GMA8713_01582 [Grimontia marina]